MDDAPVSELYELKTAIRKQAHENRRAQAEKDAVSVRIVDRFMDLAEYHSANTVMFYVDVRDEVRTRQALPAPRFSRIVSPRPQRDSDRGGAVHRHDRRCRSSGFADHADSATRRA